MVVSIEMSAETRPRLTMPVVLVICVGAVACVIAFVTRKFPLLFITGGAIWVEFLFYLYWRWWPGIPFVPGRRRTYRGIALLIGFLIFAATWEIIVWLDPSLK
jgi:hypothetical protein